MQSQLECSVIILVLSQFTRRTCFTFDNLLPHTRYIMNIGVANEFTRVDFPEQIFFLEVIHVTGPGGKHVHIYDLLHESA